MEQLNSACRHIANLSGRERILFWGAVVGVPLGWCYLSSGKKKRFEANFGNYLRTDPSVLTATPSGPISTDFKTFLRGSADEEDDHRNPADFSSFLRGTQKQLESKQAAPAPALVPEQKPTPQHAKVTVMYGTEFGFSKEISEKLCDMLKATGRFWPVLKNMADHGNGYSLQEEQVVLFVCSTQGDGVPPAEARDFCEWLVGGKAGKLPTLNYSVCALGDKSYTHYCRCGKQLDAALQAAGAAAFVPRADINKEDWKTINAWLADVVAGLPALGLKTVEELGGDAVIDTAPAEATVKRWGKMRPYPARVVAVEGLCTLTDKDDKETVRVELDLGDSGMTYLPGDALGIYPMNQPQAVDELLLVLGASGDELVNVPSWHYEESGEASSKTEDGRMPLRDAFLKCYDLRSPKPDILQLLSGLLPAAPVEMAPAAVAAAAAEQPEVMGKDLERSGSPTSVLVAADGSPDPVAQAAKLAALRASSEAAQEAYFAARHVVDVLLDFSGAKPGAAQLLSVLRQLQPRLYSISSSPLEDGQRVQATIAVVHYSQLARERIGVCSTFVAERVEVGSLVPVYISKNPDFRLPDDAATPIIMVGPGTGLAPFRSFILQRLLQQKAAGTASGQMVLYFGCRRRDQDYLYGSTLDGWHASGEVTLMTAFSREQAGKVYVQQRLRESADLVWKLLQEGAHFYVCGDAGSMAGAVEAALLDIIAQRLGGEEAALSAQAYLDDLSKHKRYQRDVWY